jgi:hypothetical protein
LANYPDWVLRHKEKGTYINRVGDKYYLYAAHSERVPGTKKVKRVHDGYLGRITEQDGLIPVRDKVQGDISVYEYGLCMTLLSLCDNIHTGLRREFRAAADRILVAGILSAAYGEQNQEAYQWSYLSVQFPGLDMGKPLTDKQAFAAQRCERMAKEVLRKQFGEDAPLAAARLSRLVKVRINGQYYLPAISEETEQWLTQQKLDWRGWFGKS